MDLKRLAEEERTDLADFLDTLSVEEWATQTLCDQWTVHDVVAHMLSYEELSAAGLVGRFLRGRLGVDKVNAIGVAEYRSRSSEELLMLLREHLVPRGLTAGFGGGIALTDGLIHHQDIRRPLARPRQVPAERLVPALGFALKAPPIRGARRARGLRLVATDLDWSLGEGPEVSGTAEALLMAVSGRSAALPELHGPGLPTLTARLS